MSISLGKAFFLASRPKTLPAGIIPVMLGSSLAYRDGSFDFLIALITLVCSIFIQIVTNYINEIYDFKKGADTSERIGPQRMVASQIISVKQMIVAVITLIIITFGLGLVLVAHSDINILYVGLASLLFAWLYTGGPFPLAYNGLGDVFVLLFFGIIAVCGSYYVQLSSINWEVFVVSFTPGLLSVNILGVNNYRDIETDSKVGKNTLSVKIGKRASIFLFRLLMILSYMPPIYLYIISKNYWYLSPIITIVLAFKLMKDISLKTGKELNSILAGTGKLLFIYGIIFSIIIILAR